MNATIERLRSIPIHDSDEVWEVTVLQLPTTIKESEDASPWQPLCAVCVSTLGGVASSEPMKAAELPASSALDALAAFALGSHVPGAKPLHYLPARVRVAQMPANVHEHFIEAMSRLNVAVEVKQRLPHIDEFEAFITEVAAAEGVIDAPALLKVKGMTVDRVRAFADAGTAFWNASPWNHLADEVAWVIEPQPKHRTLRSCLVMGAGDEEFGLAFMESAAQFRRLATAISSTDEILSQRGTVWSVTFEPIERVPLPDQELWTLEQFSIPDSGLIPIPLGMTERLNVKRPSPDQLTLMEGLLRGFAGMDPTATGRDTLEFDVSTFDGPTTLRLQCGARL